eukprot:TRINITY_DN7226_c0_g1_i1.p1 TRINITY_DN7226_c0_g1~~TRINITY_DN7226_c0_g1_i1.p1  ORF type:complete len:153 (-),score=33.13 TRINITY_DN7226_c0_g1_i1:58-516(-)
MSKVDHPPAALSPDLKAAPSLWELFYEPVNYFVENYYMYLWALIVVFIILRYFEVFDRVRALIVDRKYRTAPMDPDREAHLTRQMKLRRLEQQDKHKKIANETRFHTRVRQPTDIDRNQNDLEYNDNSAPLSGHKSGRGFKPSNTMRNQYQS